MKIFFTSDTHFGHQNILAYCNRPFSTLEEMNEGLIDRWNSRVLDGDVVYHIGDFAMGQRHNILIRKRLNGRVILIRGNHDRAAHIMKTEAGFDEVHDNLALEVDGIKLYLSHIPLHVYDPTQRKYDPKLLQPAPVDADYILCGHVHQQWNRIGNTINVGTDVSNYYPLTLSELLGRDNA
jgi:calcineurin-like phosphoesterase family protein